MESTVPEYAIQKNPNICATVLDGELVVMGEDNIYYRINRCGIHIWNLLELHSYSVDRIVAFIANLYEVEPSLVRSDVASFVLLMLKKGIFCQGKE